MSTAPRNHALVLTPRAAGAIAVVRLVGPDSPRVADRLLRAVSGRSVTKMLAGRIGYGRFVDRDEVIDDVIFSRASSGDTSAIDICTHGGPRVVQRLTQALETAGVPVLPESQQETPLWPVRNRIEADADRALLKAKTQRAVRFLAWQRHRLAGELERCAKLCVVDPHQAGERLSAIAQRERGAASLVAGATVTIIGPPNSGKSTLFNRLVGRTCALVSDTPGTTRDWVRQSVEMNGVPLELVDTAGTRETPDALERLAIELGRDVATRSEVRLLVVDAAAQVSGPTHELIERFRGDSGTRVILNKSDKGISPDNVARVSASHGTTPPLVVSATTGTGIESVIEAILGSLDVTEDLDGAPAPFCMRQTMLLSDILEALSGRPRRGETLIRNDLIGLGVDSGRPGCI